MAVAIAITFTVAIDAIAAIVAVVLDVLHVRIKLYVEFGFAQHGDIHTCDKVHIQLQCQRVPFFVEYWRALKRRKK